MEKWKTGEHVWHGEQGRSTLSIKLLTTAPMGGESSGWRDTEMDEHPRRREDSCAPGTLKTRRYDRVKPQQSRCKRNNIPSAALQQTEEKERHPQI